MKLSYPNTNFTIAQYIIMPYYKLDNRWKPYIDKINFKLINDRLEWIYINKNDIFYNSRTVIEKQKNKWFHIILKNNKINYTNLSCNSSNWACEILKNNIDKICFSNLSFNSNKKVSHILLNNIEKINWENLSHNYGVIAKKLLQKYPQKIHNNLLYNHSKWAFKIFENIFSDDNVNNIFIEKKIYEPYKYRPYYNLFANKNKNIMKICEKYPDKIHWDTIYFNSAEWIEKIFKLNPDKIDWGLLSACSANWAVKMLKENPDKIDWFGLINNNNEQALEIIYNNLDKIDDFEGFNNPHIFIIEKSVSNNSYRLFDKLLHNSFKN